MSIAVTEDGQVVSWGNENAVDIFASKVKKEKIKEVKSNIQTGMALTKDGRVISLAKKETAFDKVPEEIQGKVEKIASDGQSCRGCFERWNNKCVGKQP